MKVLLLNGSPHQKGCTNRALEEVAKSLENEGIETEIFWIGSKPVPGCIACGKCSEGKGCVFNDDRVNEFGKKAEEADGFIFGSPVYYAGASGQITSFLDRLFYAWGGKRFALKPAACVSSARRAGTTATFDQLIKYFTISQMPVISSTYWNNVHGNTPEEVEQDQEGLYIMRVLGKNMAFFLKCKEAGLKAGVELPSFEEPKRTNFIH